MLTAERMIMKDSASPGLPCMPRSSTDLSECVGESCVSHCSFIPQTPCLATHIFRPQQRRKEGCL